MKRIWKTWYFGLLLFLFEACNNSKGEEPDSEPVVASAAEDIFDTQMQLIYGDSLHIRVMSWGGKEAGNYLVLVADSVNGHYIGDSFFRLGRLVNAWAADLDKDGWPEIGVVLKENGNIYAGSLSLHELSGDFTFQSVQFPPLSEALGADYGGNDTIYKRDDHTIVREFQLLDRLDSLAESNHRRRIFYVLENNQLVMSGSEEIKNAEN